MWSIRFTPTPKTPKPIATVQRSPTPIATVPRSAKTAAPLTVASDGTFTQPAALQRIDHIVVNGQQRLKPAANSEQGGFTQGRLEILTPGAFTAIGVSVDAPIPTTRLLASRSQLGALWDLPVVGKFTYTLSLEQHPSGSLELVCHKANIAKVRNALKIGNELKLMGIGFAVSGYKESLNNSQIYRVSVSLSGKWSAEKYNRSSFLRGKSISSGSEGELDPQCSVTDGRAISQSGSSSPSVSIASLAAQVGVEFVPYGKGWAIDIPENTPRDAATKWNDSLQQRARPNAAFLDWTGFDAVRVRSFDAVKTHVFSAAEIEVQCSGDTANSPTHYGYAVEYKNAELTGIETDKEPNDDPNKQLPVPQWLKRPSQKIVLRSGDANPEQPPDNVKILRNLSHNFDASGATKTLRIATTIDGQAAEVEEFIYGFLYTAAETFAESSGEIYAPAASFWRLVSYKKQTFLYDPQYGFGLGYNTTGFRFARLRQESDDAYETLIDPTDDDAAAKASLYRFQQVPIIERSRLEHHAFATYYQDVEEQPAWAAYKHCNRDGTSSTYYIKDPSWAPAMFTKEEISYASSFAKALNPEYDPTEEYSAENPPPPRWLITGEESLNRQEIVPNPATKNFAGVNAAALAKRLGFVDIYTQRSVEDSAQNANFRDKAIRETFAESEGRPSPSSRRPSKLERVDRSSDDQQPDGSAKRKSKDLRYTVCTPGYSSSDPVEGSISFPNAKTPLTALAGAKAELFLQDVQQSATVNCLIPFTASLRPLDIVEVEIDAEWHRLRATSIENSIVIHGLVDDRPMFTWEPSKLTGGIDRSISVTMATKQVQTNANQDTGGTADDSAAEPRTISPVGLVIKAESVAEIAAEFASIESRGNF